jgi:D-alanyl-D-alanine dipeptidase
MTRWRSLWLVLIVHSFSASQPAEPQKRFRASELVELTKLDSTLRLDIRYATDNNFMKRPMYTQARAFLQRPAAEALCRAHTALRAQGYGLLIFDGYRPWSVTKKFWDETPPAKRIYVANPKKGSKHNRGCAVDLTLYDLKTGKEVEMPTPYDDFTIDAAADSPAGTDEQRRARRILREAMEAQGFTVNPDEWWHFDYRDWRAYRILDIPFEKIR